MGRPAQRRAQRLERRHTGSDIGQRVLIGVPAAAFAVVVIYAGVVYFAALALVLGIVALGELFGMYQRVRPVRLAGFVGLIGLAAAAYYGGEHHVLLTVVAFVALMFAVAIMTPGGPSETARMSLTLLGVVWIGMAIAHAILLRELAHGEAIIVDILVGTFIGDTGAYLGGRAFGSRRLAPAISPNKTVEGLVVGMFTAVASVVIAGLYQDWLSLGQSLLLGLAVAVAAPLGDLFESQVKRDAKTKDAGRLFGAHGGALDRLDAAFFALVAGYYVWHGML